MKSNQPGESDIEVLATELANSRKREYATQEILQVISLSRDDVQPVFDAILERACDLCEAPSAGLLLGRPQDKTMTFAASLGEDSSFDAALDYAVIPVDRDAAYAARALLDGETYHLEDMGESELYHLGSSFVRNNVDKLGIRSVIFTPLMGQDGALGTMALFRKEVRPFDREQIKLVESFAAQAAIAIENARQFKALQTRLSREAATREILEVISQSRDDEQPVFNAILKRASLLCKSPQAGLMLLNSAGTKLEFIAGWGPPTKHFVAGVSEWSIDDPIAITTAVRENRIVNVPDLQADHLTASKHPSRMEIVEKEGIRSILAVPLIKDGKAIGCFDVFRLEVEPFSEDDEALLRSFATQAVIAIENVQQFKALESLNAELGDRVQEQVGEIERMGLLKRFLPAAVADTVISQGSEEMLASHRALLGVLFCDIRGFTAFCESAEPEETIEVLQTYHQELGKLINDHGAGVDPRMGDGIMVLFNDPLPCEDPAGDAVRLAIAMQEKMAELCKSWKRLGYRLGFGVGVSLGYATVGMVGHEGRSDYTASGTAVNIAARLCDEAADGEILLSARAAVAVEENFKIESRGELSLKGVREAVEVFELT
ncbi:MAG: GAF domain-containing protein [Pseudomonadota bacterium]